MADKDEEVNKLTRSLAHFVPTGEWFNELERSGVFIKVFRVFRALFDDFPSFPYATVLDLNLVRAVFVRGNLLYPDFDSSWKLFPTPDGDVGLKAVVWTRPTPEEFVISADREIWRHTGEGVMLLLITPSLIDGADVPEDTFKGRLELIRAIILAILGRNAAFEELFGVELEVGGEVQQDKLHFKSLRRDHPMAFAPPELHDQNLGLVKCMVERIENLDEDTRNRVIVALRWYQRAQGYRATEEDSDVDGFISLWVALETLAPGRDPVKSINRVLADVHCLSTQDVGEIFLIGRLSNLRGRIVHHGKIPYIEGRLLRFMSAIFVDVLVYILGLSNTLRTNAFKGGVARETVHVSQQSL